MCIRDRFQGVVHKYRPDFIVKLMDDTNLVIEVKGIETQQDQIKWEYMKEWIQAVNEYGSFGKWEWKVAAQAGEIGNLLE